MASGSSFSAMLLFGKRNDDENVNEIMNIQQDMHVAPPAQPQIVPLKKRRNPLEVPYPDAEVIALSPTTLMAKNRFVCEVCYKGFPRDQNLQLHKRGHNLPWKLKRKTTTDEVKRKVYLCPEPSCINHDPSHALGDLTGIKKHYSRKHGEKKYKCKKCEKMYAVKSDLKAHLKTCGTKEYHCHCGTLFSRRDSFISHRAFCDALAEVIPTTNLPQSGYQAPSTQNLTRNNLEIAPGVSEMGRKSYNNVMIKTATELNYHKPTPALLGQSSDHRNEQRYQENSNTGFFTNLMNSTTTADKNMQLYNLNFMGNTWNSGSGEGSSFFSRGRSDHSTLLHLSSHTSSIPQLSATEFLQKAAILGSTSSANNVTNFVAGYASSFSGVADEGTKSETGKFLLGNSHIGKSGSNGYRINMNELMNSFNSSGVGSSIFTGSTNEHDDGYQGGLDSGSGGYDDEWKNWNSLEQQPPQNSSFNMGFEQFSGVKMTRDFLGVGVEVLDNKSGDGPKGTFAERSFL